MRRNMHVAGVRDQLIGPWVAEHDVAGLHVHLIGCHAAGGHAL